MFPSLIKKISSFMAIIIMCFIVMHSNLAAAQSLMNKSIAIQLSDTLFNVSNKDLKDVIIQLSNNGSSPFSGALFLKSGKGAKVVTKDSVHVKIEPGQKIFVPSKIYINQNAGEGTIPVALKLKDDNNTIVDSNLLKFVLAPSRLLTISIEQTEIILQNGASNVGLSFSTNDAFANGVETSFTDGLKISSVDGRYEIKVQSSSDYFTYSGALTTIATNKIQIVPSQGSTSITSSTYTPVNMNATQQTLITNLGNQGTANNYNLKFTTKQNANQSAFTGIQSGVYATQVSFIMNPL